MLYNDLISTLRQSWRNILNREARSADLAGIKRRGQLPTATVPVVSSEDIELCARSGLFDPAWYLKGDLQGELTPPDALVHYLRHGEQHGRAPNPLFDADWYRQRSPDVAQAGLSPLVHYLRTGAREGRDPSPHFDGAWYLERNPDVATAGLNPLAHYLKWGAAEGRIRRPRPAPFVPPSSPLKVSAIIPCWNGERWLGEALESITTQTYPLHEIIVVDDCSTDGSGEVARRYPARVIRNETNRGEGASRNVGLRHASGDLIAWLDADDLWLPNHVATLVGLLQTHPTAAGAFAAVQRFGLRNELIRGYVPEGEPSHVFWQALRDWLHTTIGSMTRRSVLLEAGGFDETERYSVDFDLWVRLSRSHLFVCTHEVTSMWRWHEGQQSAQLAEQTRALYRYRRRYLEQEIAVGDLAFAEVMQRRLAEIWHEDRRDAAEKGQPLVERALDEVRPLIFGSLGETTLARESLTRESLTKTWGLRSSLADLRRVLAGPPASDRLPSEIQDAARPQEAARSAIVESGLFDAEWYLTQHPDVAVAGIDALDHYIAAGGAEGRDPNPLFDSDWYLAQYPEVAAAGLNPLVDYVLYGLQAGREPNPYFDSRWYLEQNPDVAAAGQNPLTHYLRWGAAKGLDPSVRFETTWYLERHPDIAAAGVNPLAHYMRWGKQEKREPISPIPQFFEDLARRPDNAPEDFDWLRETYTPPLGVQPDLAGADNNIVVGVAWAEHFMSSSLALYARGDLPGALRLAKYAAQTLPHENDPMRLYCYIFAECNRRALEDFAQAFSTAELLILHVSYKGGLEHAEASCRSFSDPSGRIANIIVIGDTAAEDTFRFDRDRSILFVPAPDSYEALPRKVAKAFLFLGMSRLNLTVLKVDDDATCQDPAKLTSLIDPVFAKHLYGGRVNPRAGTASCAFWHFGKCTADEINGRPDGLLWVAPYAGGQGYWLNGKAAAAMAKICVLHERYFEIEHFEDRAVGTVLAQYGLRPFHFDVIAQGLVGDHNQPPGRGKPPLARLRGFRESADVKIP